MVENTQEILENSYATFGGRGPKTAENPHGWYEIKALSPDDPVVITFGGQSTTSDQAANHYCKIVEEVLDRNNCQEGVRVIGVVNHYGDSYDPFLSRSAGVNNVQECDKEKLNEETLNPQYVKDIFEFAVKNRLCNEEGKRLDIDTACHRMRKLNILVHCHGGSSFAQLEKLSWQEMKKLGYSKEEREQVLQELLVVAYAPYTTLGKSKAKMISFVSDTDQIVTYNNRIEDTIRYKKDIDNEKTATCFFDGRLGNVFRANSFGDIDQHELDTLYPDEQKLNDDGRTCMQMLRTALVHGVQSSVYGTKLGDVKDIVCNNEMEKDYINSLSNRGEEVWDSLTETYRRDSDKIIPYAQQFKHNKYFNEQEATSARMEYLKEQEQKQHRQASVTIKTAVPHTEAKPIRGKSNPELYTRFIGSIMGLKNAAQELKAREGKAAHASLSLSGPSFSKIGNKSSYRIH